MMDISIHALLAESDLLFGCPFLSKPLFLSTLSLRRATMHALIFAHSVLFLSTLSLRRATMRAEHHASNQQEFLSTLSLRRATHQQGTSKTPHFNFYPRSPCGERRGGFGAGSWPLVFLSTLSLRRATLHCNTPITLRHYFYPRSPCGERRRNGQNINRGHTISIHALLAESDSCTSIGRPKRLYFYPRSPCGERPLGGRAPQPPRGISIHALLAESDQRTWLSA